MVKALVETVDASLIAFTRILLGGLCIGALSMAKHGFRMPKSGWKLVLVGAFGISLNYLLFTIGLRHTLASAGAMVVQTEVIFLVLLSVLLLGESFGPRKMTGTVIAILGVVIISWNGEDLGDLLASRYLLGNVIVACGGLCWSFYAFSQKMLTRDEDVLVVLLPVFLLSSAILLPFAMGSLGTIVSIGWVNQLSLLYLGLICTGLGYILLAQGMKGIPASTAGVLTTFMPVTSVILAHMFLKEALTPYIITGAILDLGGIAMVMSANR